jgi:predicted HicB family RNase H-like nuclease
MSLKHYLDSFPGRNDRHDHMRAAERKGQQMITVRCDPEMHMRLKEAAAKEKISLNGLLISLSKAYLNRK